MGTYSGSSHQRRKDLLQDRRLGEGQSNFEHRTQSSSAQQGPIAFRTSQLRAIRSRRAIPGFVHLRKRTRGDGDDGKGCSDHRDQARADIVWRLDDVEAGDLDGREDTAHDERGGDQILRRGRSKIHAALSRDDDGGSDDPRQHGQRVLETEDQSQDNGHTLVESEERCCSLDSPEKW